jgi:quinol monooxygenase YgiN
MLIILTEMSYPPESDQQMHALVPDVERYCRRFEGCEQFALSFPVNRPGTLLGSEVWRDDHALRAHVAVAHHAPELGPWHALVTGMKPALFSAAPMELAAVLPKGAKP